MFVKDIVGCFVLVKQDTDLLNVRKAGHVTLKSKNFLKAGSVVFIDSLIRTKNTSKESYYIVIINQDLKKQEIFYSYSIDEELSDLFEIIVTP